MEDYTDTALQFQGLNYIFTLQFGDSNLLEPPKDK